MLSLASPYPFFTDKDGDPLDGGYIYVGQVNQNPETAPVVAYWDEAGTQPAAQPLRTLAGFIVRNGTPARVYVDGDDSSMTVKDKRGVVLFYERSVTGASGLRSDLLDPSDPAKNSGMIAFNPTLNYAVGTLGAKISQRVSVKDFPWLAKGNGITDDSAALNACYAWAGAHGAEVWHPPGDYLAENLDLEFTKAYALMGPTTNSVFTRANFLQKSFNTPLFRNKAINLRVSGLCFTCFAGSSYTAAGTQITVTSTGANSLTLSANPWQGMSPVIWTPENSYVATDGTLYPNVIRFNAMGAWVASGATVNGDGTVTLTGVKGSDGTLNTSLPGTVGSGVTFISLAHTLPDSAFTNPQAATFFMDVRENQFFDHLWFNQVGRCFAYDALGSGGGVSTGVGNAGIMNALIVDQAKRFIYAAGSINALQIDNAQFYGVRCVFDAVGNIQDSIFSDLKLHTSQRLFDVGGDFIGNAVSGCNFNALTGQGYCDDMINVAGSMTDSVISSNLIGRSSNVAPFMTMGTADGFTFTGNGVISHSEGANIGCISVTGASFINSVVDGNNFESKFGSGARRLVFTNTAASITGSRFGADVVHNTNHTGIGFIPVAAFSNGWVNAGAGTKAVAYFKNEEGIVQLTGVASGGTLGAAIFTLPAGYRPTATIRIPIAVTAAFGYIEIAASGVVSIFSAAANSWAAFDGAAFPTV